MRFLPRRALRQLEKLAGLYPTVLVSGPRQTGKTALVRNRFPQHEWILFDDALLAEQANRDPKLFLLNHPPPFILDEIQHAPGLFPALKEFVDRNDPPAGTMILTGSQPLPLMQLVSESLAGRIGLLELLPMTPAEIFEHSTIDRDFASWLDNPPIGEKFEWKAPPFEYLLRGGLPRMALPEHSPAASDACQRLRDYIQTYLSKDLRDLSAITDLGRFERFLRVLGASSAKILDLSEIARHADLPQGTAHDWLSLLQASLIVWQVQGFATNRGKRERKRPKSIVIDPGLVCSLLSITSVDQLSKNPLTGFITESAAGACIRASLFRSASAVPPVYHWNYENKREVDFVVESAGSILHPVEVKLTSRPGREHCQGLDAFIAAYPKKAGTAILISTYEECFWIEKNILHIPLSGL